MPPNTINPGPTADVVRAWRTAAGLTQAQAAEMVHVSLNAWERWEIDPSRSSARRMPMAAFELFCKKAPKKRPKRP